MKQPYKWEFPGGKIEAGETDEECIIRELHEELGIYIHITGKLKECEYDYGNFRIVLVPFLADLNSGVITLSEHMNFAWLDPVELKSLDWAPADMAVVEAVLKKFLPGTH